MTTKRTWSGEEKLRIDLLLDDTLFHRRGRKVEGAGLFRDAVRSSKNSVVYDRGLNLLVLALRVRPPWGGEPLALPLAVRLHRKGGTTLPDLGARSVQRLAERHADREFHLIADGAYAPLAGSELPHTVVTPRIRRDAALYDFPAPRRPGQNGRPRKKGERLPSLTTWTTQTHSGWENVVGGGSNGGSCSPAPPCGMGPAGPDQSGWWSPETRRAGRRTTSCSRPISP